MKKILVIFAILFMGLAVNASENYLRTVVVEGTDDGYNIILKADGMPTIKKTVKDSNNIILDVKGISTSAAVNAIYKSTSDVSNLIVENVADDELKVYIKAKEVSKATIMAQTLTGEPVILSERFPVEKILWSLVVLIILGMIIKSAKSITDYENSIVIKKDIKDREIELYRNFQKELETLPKINCKINSSYATTVMLRSRRNYKELARR